MRTTLLPTLLHLFSSLISPSTPSPLLPSPRPTILFVPGAWLLPSGFDAVRVALETRGFATSAVGLPSVGNSNASVGLPEDITAVRISLETLLDDGRDVVVVAHSYGGEVASGAVRGLDKQARAEQEKTNGVSLLVYLAAFVVRTNETLGDALGGAELPDWLALEDGFLRILDPATTFFADSPPAIQAAAVAATQLQPAVVFNQPAVYAPWTTKKLPVAYFFTLQDRALPLAKQREFAAEFPRGSFTYALNSSHTPFYSEPGKLADGLMMAVDTVVEGCVL